VAIRRDIKGLYSHHSETEKGKSFNPGQEIREKVPRRRSYIPFLGHPKRTECSTVGKRKKVGFSRARYKKTGYLMLKRKGEGKFSSTPPKRKCVTASKKNVLIASSQRSGEATREILVKGRKKKTPGEGQIPSSQKILSGVPMNSFFSTEGGASSPLKRNPSLLPHEKGPAASSDAQKKKGATVNFITAIPKGGTPLKKGFFLLEKEDAPFRKILHLFRENPAITILKLRRRRKPYQISYS